MSYIPPRNRWNPPWTCYQGEAKPRPDMKECEATVVHTFKDDAGEWKWEHPFGVAYGDPRAIIKVKNEPERGRGCTNWAMFAFVLVVGLSLILTALWLYKVANTFDAPRTWTTLESEDGK